MTRIKIGYAPTRRSIFSAPDAVKYRGLTAQRLKELNIDFVDITDINEEGLLYDDGDRIKIAEKFKRENIDGLFLPHCNFGTEFECARLAKDLNVPVLLWGPLDERPEADGTRLRDTQCGLFATGKVLRRFNIPFTYMTNCRLEDPVFERGLRDFLAVCNVVKTFRNIRILQISTRPYEFWSTMCNEGELLEKFNIQLTPIPMPELTDEMKKAKEEGRAEVTCWGDGSPLREFLYVDDLANLCVFLMNNYSGDETVNAGTGKEITIRELTELVAGVVGYEGKILWDTSKPNGTPRKLLDVSKAEKLGWHYMTELEDGIRLSYEDFLSNPMRAER